MVCGWAVLGQNPAERLYPTAETVVRFVERGLLVPAIGQPWDASATEYNLSAVGWRALGWLYTDRTAEVELRVYEVAGTLRDTPLARRFRSITADWRARQARRDTTPGWNRWSEFDLTVSDKVTGDGTQTVTVLFESGKQSGGNDVFEFFGPVNSAGYAQHTQAKNTMLSATVNQRAYEIAVELVGKFATEKAELKRAEAARAPKPPLRIIDPDDDAVALAMSLGLL
jgi:hypothetical protein